MNTTSANHWFNRSIHSLLVPLPVAFLAGMLLADIVFASSGLAFVAKAAVWLGLAGLLTGFITSVFGLINFAASETARQQNVGWVHVLGGTATLFLTSINLWLRAMDPVNAVIPSGLSLSSVVAVLLIVTGSYGSELSRRLRTR